MGHGSSILVAYRPWGDQKSVCIERLYEVRVQLV